MVDEDARRRLDRATVLSAAEELVDAEGPGALTMTTLAARLGVRPSSLYNHVHSLEELEGELQNRAMRQLGVALRKEAMGRSGEGGLRALAHALREFALAHPARYDMAMRASHDREGFAAAAEDSTAAFAAIIRSYGVEDLSLDLQLSAFAALHGVLELENAGFLAPPLDADRIFATVLDMVVGLLDDTSSDALSA